RTPLAGPRRRREHRGLPRRDLPGPCARAAAGRRRHGGRRRAPRAGAWPERRGLLEGGRSAGRRAVRRRRLDALRGRKGVSTRGLHLVADHRPRGVEVLGGVCEPDGDARAVRQRHRQSVPFRGAAGVRGVHVLSCGEQLRVQQCLPDVRVDGCPARPPARARRSRSAGADAALFIYGLEAVFFANSASSWGGHRSGSGITVGPKTMRATSACPSSPDPWHQAGRTRARAQRAPRACALQQRSLLCPALFNLWEKWASFLI
ncbi:unnamed protein product, partial [Prorocentrum cordatum]